MLAPRYSLRLLFALTLIAALASMIGVWAYNDTHWAAGVASAMIVVGAMFGLQIVAFAFYWVIGKLFFAARWKNRADSGEPR